MVKNLKGKELDKFKEDFFVEGHFPPITFISLIDSQKYVICIGNPWIPIPDDMDISDVNKKWIKKEFSKPKNKIEISIKSARGKGEYIVSFDKTWKCNCSGFNFRRSCSHIDKAKLEFKKKIK